MKKRLVSIMLVLSMAFGLVACGGSSTEEEAPAEEATEEEAPAELTKVKWNYGGSGNVLVTIANEKGYFAEEGIQFEKVDATQNMDAMALLAAGKVDVVSNAGTSNPLQQIAQGVDITVFGGHMIEGCMPVIALPDTEWNGIESFVGETVAVKTTFDVVETPLSVLPFILTEGFVLSIVLISFVNIALSLLFLSLILISKVLFSVTVRLLDDCQVLPPSNE